MMSTFGFGFMMIFYFIGIVAGIALLVLIFVVLLKANKLLSLKIEKEENDKRQPPPLG